MLRHIWYNHGVAYDDDDSDNDDDDDGLNDDKNNHDINSYHWSLSVP